MRAQPHVLQGCAHRSRNGPIRVVTGREDETLDVTQAVLQCVDELQQEGGVRLHAAADVAQQDNARLSHLALLAGQLEQGAAVSDVASERTSQIELLPATGSV
jgi:serine phosphatase RsbU (regulator of sigma subunit)